MRWMLGRISGIVAGLICAITLSMPSDATGQKRFNGDQTLYSFMWFIVRRRYSYAERHRA